jgi:hypothetical protein
VKFLLGAGVFGAVAVWIFLGFQRSRMKIPLLGLEYYPNRGRVLKGVVSDKCRFVPVGVQLILKYEDTSRVRMPARGV